MLLTLKNLLRKKARVKHQVLPTSFSTNTKIMHDVEK